MIIRHLGMSESENNKGVFHSTFEFGFDGHKTLYAQIKVDTNVKNTPEQALVSWAMDFESMLFEINEEHERMLQNV